MSEGEGVYILITGHWPLPSIALLVAWAGLLEEIKGASTLLV